MAKEGGPHDDLIRCEVHVLDPRAAAFQQPQAGAIEQGIHEPGRSLETPEDRLDLLPGQDDGQPLRSVGVDEVV